MMSALRERGAWAVVVVVAVVAALPWLVCAYPIAQDLPAHTETAAQLLGVWRGDAFFADHVWRGPLWPNATPIYAIAGLTFVGVDGFVATKLVLWLGLVAWPLSLAALLVRLGRSPAWACLLVPTAYDLSLSYGFLHFVVGKPLFVLALCVAIDAARGTRRALLPLTLLVLFATHLMLFVVAAALCAGIVVVVSTAQATTRAATLALVAAAVVPFAVWNHGRPTPAGEAAFLSLQESLGRAWSNSGDLHAGVGDGVVWGVCGAALLLTVFAHLWARAPLGLDRARVALVVVTVAIVGFAVLGPVRLPGVSIVAERFWSIGAALMGVVVIACAGGTAEHAPARSARGLRIALAAAAVLATGGLTVDHARRFVAFENDDMGTGDTSLRALLAAVPPGSRVATHYRSPLSRHGRYHALWHWPKLVSLGGSKTDDDFAVRDTCVVGLSPGARPLSHPRLGDRAALAGYDYVVVEGGAVVGGAVRVAAGPRFALWRVTR
jgi:hypothetical protein